MLLTLHNWKVHYRQAATKINISANILLFGKTLFVQNICGNLMDIHQVETPKIPQFVSLIRHSPHFYLQYQIAGGPNSHCALLRDYFDNGSCRFIFLHSNHITTSIHYLIITNSPHSMLIPRHNNVVICQTVSGYFVG